MERGGFYLFRDTKDPSIFYIRRAKDLYKKVKNPWILE